MAGITVAGELYHDLDGQFLEIKRQLRQPGGYPFNPEVLRGVLQDVIEGRFYANGRAAEMSPPIPILSRLYADEKITVGATDGTETIAGSEKTFPGYLDPSFKKLGLDKPGQPMGPTPAEVHEMRQDATFARMFGALGDVQKLIWEQSQIVEFCRTHSDRLRQDGYATFFLFEEDTGNGPELFVADVGVDGRGLGASVCRFGNGRVWRAVSRLRVVVPQLKH